MRRSLVRGRSRVAPCSLAVTGCVGSAEVLRRSVSPLFAVRSCLHCKSVKIEEETCQVVNAERSTSAFAQTAVRMK